MGAKNSYESQTTCPTYILGCNETIPELTPQYIPIKKNAFAAKAIPPVKPVELPGFTFEYHSEFLIKDNECCICHEEYKQGDLVHMLPCNHVFNRSCILRWYDQKSETCPTCEITEFKYETCRICDSPKLKSEACIICESPEFKSKSMRY